MSENGQKTKSTLNFVLRKEDNRIYLVFIKEGKEEWDIDITDEVMDLVFRKVFIDLSDGKPVDGEKKISITMLKKGSTLKTIAESKD